MRCRTFSATLVFFVAASCTNNVRLQFADQPFDPALASELAAVSKQFAAMKGLSFEDYPGGTSRAIALRGRHIEIDATVENRRLKIAVFGPTTPKSAYIESSNLGSQYIRLADEVRSDCPQCAGFTLEDMRD